MMNRKKGIDMSLFDLRQQEQIIGGIQDKLSSSQIKLVANPLLDPKQMWQIRYGFINNLSLEEVALYADASLSAEEMALKRLSLVSAKEEVDAEEMVDTWVR